ncbi:MULTISPECIES: hypothetical protein [Paraburkholderia]|uniref:hypothetical protein n=1 Tax=Paraburkholderia TaxID=1822464 RepID=UPI001CB18D2A|nr:MULTISPECIES: hypothetical protein [Paraburkholderia]GJH03339.1 hypothetical protein CBA19C8_22300 [Paraburkholderia terrae]CAG9270342.1 conserved exported hypothetical protein [Paraburkholderia caribensis]
MRHILVGALLATLLAALLATANVSFISPACASGYGPAPFYRPDIGAPPSQRGENAQTLRNVRNAGEIPSSTDVGGVNASSSQSGVGEAALTSRTWTFRHH